MKKVVFVLALFFPLTCFAAEQPGASLTLQEAQRIALENHPDIKASDFDATAFKDDITAARSTYFPQISGNAVRAFAGTDTRIAATGGLNNPTVLDRGSAGIGVNQMITDFGRTRALVDASKSEYAAQLQRANLSRVTVLLNVTRAYYDVLRAQALIKVAGETLKSRQTFLDQIHSLRNVKMKSDLDLSMARQALDDAHLLEIKAQNSRDTAMAALCEAMGYGETRDFVLSDDRAAARPALSQEDMIQLALKANPNVKALQASYDAAKHDAIAAGRESYPTLNAIGFVGATPIRDDDQHINANYATGGLNLSLPIFTGGKLTADADKAQARVEAAAMRLQEKKNALTRDVHTVAGGVETAYKNIEVTKQMHENTRKSLELTRARYEIGKSSIVDLNQAQLAETQAAVAETDAIYDYRVQQAFLDYTIGNLPDQAIKTATR